MPEIVPHEKELVDFFDFFSVPEKLNQLVGEQPAIDELEVYMAIPAEPKNCDVIAWWCICRHRTPRLAKMAQQFLATPATSAGVGGCSVQRASITLILLPVCMKIHWLIALLLHGIIHMRCMNLRHN